MLDVSAVVLRLRTLCEKQGISGVEFGAALGLKKSPLTDWKNHKSKPTLEQIAVVCEKFAMSSDYILFGRLEKDALQKGELELLANYSQLDDRGQHKVHTVLYEELDRMQHINNIPPIPFAASGWADMPPEAEGVVQQHLQRFEQQNKELHDDAAAKDEAVWELLKKGTTTKEP